jgi:exosortase/archaeosortase family protein
MQMSPTTLRREKFRNNTAFRFPLLFIGFLSIAWLIDNDVLALPVNATMQAFTAKMVLLGSNAVGLRAALSGTTVVPSGGIPFDVTTGCTGLAVALVVIAAVLAYPAPRRAKIVGLGVLVPLVFVVNIARLVSMGWAGTRSQALFDFFHLFAWQFMIVAFVGLGFWLWARLSSRGGDKVRFVLLEAARALGIFTAVFLTLFFLGVKGGFNAYVMVLNWFVSVIAGLSGMRWSIPHTIQSVIDFGLWPYLTWSSFVALFLATPRIHWKTRAVGAFAILTPVLVLPYAFYVAVDVNHPMSPGMTDVLDIVFDFGVPVVTWLLWARASWKRPGLYACPACGERHDLIVEHIKMAHPIKTGKILARLRNEHPELSTE